MEPPHPVDAGSELRLEECGQRKSLQRRGMGGESVGFHRCKITGVDVGSPEIRPVEYNL